jgi:DNA-binding MarR family transcriptional regulator
MVVPGALRVDDDRSGRQRTGGGRSLREEGLDPDALRAQAAELLLSFMRLARGPRDHSLPAPLRDLIDSGALAPRHVSVFAVIALEGPLAVSELAGRVGLALSTTSLLVTQLADAGLVVRTEDPGDRRRTVVSIEPAHHRESLHVLESRLTPLRRALDRMGPERAAALLEGMEVVAAEVERGADPSSSADR